MLGQPNVLRPNLYVDLQVRLGTGERRAGQTALPGHPSNEMKQPSTLDQILEPIGSDLRQLRKILERPDV